MDQTRDPIQELINQLARLPGIGEKSATRLAFAIIDGPGDLPDSLASALTRARRDIQRCTECGHLTSSDPCTFCASSKRDRSRICVVEHTPDLFAVERTGEFDGLYHVLHGLLRPLDGVGPDGLNLVSLLHRIQRLDVREVIVATSPSVEGEATAMYISNLLQSQDVTVSRIASGLPMGGELEYADRATLGRALSARRCLK